MNALILTNGFSLRGHLMAACGIFVLSMSNQAMAQSCPNNDVLEANFSNGSSWDMCWDIRDQEGLVLKNLYYTPNSGGPRRRVLYQLNLAEIHVSFDDGSPSSFQVTGSNAGLGTAGNMHELTSADCKGGTLLEHDGAAVLCTRIKPRGYAYKFYSAVKQGETLEVFQRVSVDNSTYIVRLRFYDDGTIAPAVGYSGEIARYSDNAAYGWQLGDTTRIATSHNNSYYWRVDFDIGAEAHNDIVEEIEVHPSADRTQKNLSVRRLTREGSHDVNPDLKRSWRVRDESETNADGRPVSYHIEPLHTAHRYTGSADEPWARHDLTVTVYDRCERFIRMNSPDQSCGNSVDDYVNGEAISPGDIVLWYRINYHHVPKTEDETAVPVHWDGFAITPRDWTSVNPISSLNTHRNTAMQPEGTSNV